MSYVVCAFIGIKISVPVATVQLVVTMGVPWMPCWNLRMSMGRMIEACAKVGMKPVCDHPSYCKDDAKAIYIGQASHISFPGHRDSLAYFPSGWAAIKDRWNGLCVSTPLA